MSDEAIWQKRNWYYERDEAAYDVWVAGLFAAAGPLKGNANTWFFRMVYRTVLNPHYDKIDMRSPLPTTEEAQRARLNLLRVTPLPASIAGTGTQIQTAYAEWLAKVPLGLQPQASLEVDEP